MIAEVTRGNHMPDLVSYLFGPGRHNEHIDQHLVAGYADAVFTADDQLWQTQPGIVRRLRDEARELGWQLEFPHSRWGAEVPHGYVWHCSLSLKAVEGQLTDIQWTQAAHILIAQLGFDGADGKSPCRWVAVRHGPSSHGNDHIHIAVNLVREDGTKASAWNDYRKAGQACAMIEQRFGLQPVPGRTSGRSVPEPSRKDREISSARGEPEPLRVRLERTVRACAAAATSETSFVAKVRQRGLMIRPRYSPDHRTVTGYAVADPNRQARNRQSGTIGPVWFGGGTLASDLSLPGLRCRWPAGHPSEALGAWSAATGAVGPSPASKTTGSVRRMAGDPQAAADLLAAAATTCEPASGPLARAARLMAKAAQHQQPAPRHAAVADTIAAMADTFLAVTGKDSVITLVAEIATLIDTCIEFAEARQARPLVHASLAVLTQDADRQARAVLSASVPKEVTMSDLTHEEEFLGHLATAGALAAHLARTAMGQSSGEAPDVKALKAAGYREDTPYDEHLRRELGERRWAKYVADPARIVCAALITDGAAQGRDMRQLLTKAADMRGWEDDPRSPARSIARVLAYRIGRELNKAVEVRTSTGTTASYDAPSAVLTPWDEHLRAQIGEHRWRQYASDERRRDVADLLARAHADGHDVPALITHSVKAREWEDDPTSPSRRIGSVLHYRLRAAIASGRGLPQQVDHAARPMTRIAQQPSGHDRD